VSTTITQAFIKQYEREVKEAFQRRSSVLLPMVRRKPNVVGTTTTFQKAGKGAATTKSRHGLVTPMDITHTNATATMVDFYAGDWVDKLDEAKINIDERMVLSNAGAAALGRKIDNQILTVMNGNLTQTATLSATLTLAKAQEAVQTLADLDVFEDGRMWCVVNANGWNDLMNITAFASADYVNDKPFPEGFRRPKDWYGVNWTMTSAVNDFTSGSTFFGYMFHEDAVGYGHNADITAEITYSGSRVAHFVNHYMSGGAVLIDSDGAFELRWT